MTRTRRVRRALLTAAVAATLLGAELVAVPAASAAPSNVVPGAGSVVVGTDYFTNQWGAPMDFSGGLDLDLTPRRMVQNGSAWFDSGRLVLAGVGQAFLLRGDPGGLPTSAIRDPRSRPLDANRFSRMSFRMHSDRAAVGAIGYRRDCGGCTDGYAYFDIQRGWHTYDIDLKAQHDHETFQSVAHSGHGGSAWEGDISLVYLSPAFNEVAKPTLMLDDVSFYEPSSSLAVTLSGGSGNVELWYDTDNNQANDGDAANGAGETANRVGTFAAGSTVNLEAGVFRAGDTVRFYTVQGGSKSSLSSPVTVPAAGRPDPVVLSPSESGGTDWATEVRGDPWDMNQASDVWETANVAVSWSDSQLHAFGVGQRNDPVVVLNQSGRAIDATRYRKMAITISFDGPWGLEDAPGGGLVGRIVWTTHSGSVQQVSLPMVENVHRSTYIVDLMGTSMIDPAGTPDIRPWGSGVGTHIARLRFDPHEDPGGRSWHLDDVKLLRNESVDPTFDIHFADRQWAPGTKADFYADTDRSSSNGLGTLIAAGISVGQGTQTYRWDGHGVGPGSYFIHTVMVRGGIASVGTSTGRVDVGIADGGNPSIGTGAQPAAGPTQAQLIAFFTFILRTKFFCAVARFRGMRVVGSAPICNQLLGPWHRAPRRRRRR